MHTTKRGLIAATMACALFATPFCLAAENIVQSSEVSPGQETKIESLLMVGTSGLHADNALGNKQALIGAEVRKLIKMAGIPVFPIAIKREDSDPIAVVAQGVARNSSTHIISITVPRGEIYVKALTGEPTGGAKAYVVQSEVVDARTNAVVWKYTAEVKATFGAKNVEVAEAMVAKMRSDKLF
jgi:hypothetical protein